METVLPPIYARFTGSCGTDPPTREDFLSHLDRRVDVRVEDPEIRRLAGGLSVFGTLTQARKNAIKRPPWFGRGYIAPLVVPIDADVAIERTTKTAGHYTLWGDAALILSLVDEIEPVTSG